jgi:hypothetical protein
MLGFVVIGDVSAGGGVSLACSSGGVARRLSSFDWRFAFAGHHMNRCQPSSAGHRNLIVRKTPSATATYQLASRAGTYDASSTTLACGASPFVFGAGAEGGVGAARMRRMTKGVRK